MRKTRAKGTRVTIPAHVLRGLRYLTEHADAGGADDIEIDETTADGGEQWADVQDAIAWIRKVSWL